MRQALRVHPDTPTEAVARVWVDVARPASSTLTLDYVVTGAIESLAIPEAATHTRVDELWKRTCFEAFAYPAAGDRYLEFNFAPSGQWAAYALTGYRRGMSQPHLVHPPLIEVLATPRRLAVLVSLDLSDMEELDAGQDWRLGLSAVIEERGGEKSYWALTHPPGKPDFHHPEAAAITLERPEP